MSKCIEELSIKSHKMAFQFNALGWVNNISIIFSPTFVSHMSWLSDFGNNLLHLCIRIFGGKHYQSIFSSIRSVKGSLWTRSVHWTFGMLYVFLSVVKKHFTKDFIHITNLYIHLTYNNVCSAASYANYAICSWVYTIGFHSTEGTISSSCVSQNFLITFFKFRALNGPFLKPLKDWYFFSLCSSVTSRKLQYFINLARSLKDNHVIGLRNQDISAQNI